MNAWMGKALRVDLTTGTCSFHDIDISILKEYVGGRGLAAKFLMDEMAPSVRPFSPDSRIIFATGPLTGTGAPTGGRYMVVAKSPLTDRIVFCNSGGKFGVILKSTGCDLIIITGQSVHPVYLQITESNVQIKPADHLWGKNTHETDTIIRNGLPDIYAKKCSIASIGPAGENRVLFASIINDKHRAAARGGIGAVMGSKNLKAIVAYGGKKPLLADDAAFKTHVVHVRNLLKQADSMKTLARDGTPFLVDLVGSAGIMPTRNFQTGVFQETGKINAHEINTSILVRRKACFHCPIGCGRETKVEIEGKISEGEGPEYETIALFGPNCGISDLTAITRAGHRCNELGLDTISAGGTIACAMELYEKGFIPHAHVGFSINFGNADGMLKLIDMIGERKGIGDVLANGAYRLAEHYKHPDLSITVKKMELPGYDPRGLKEKGLAYATSNRGACHMRGRTFGEEMKDRFDYKGRAILLKGGQDYLALLDACGLCCLIRGVVKVNDLLPVIEAATGAGFDEQGLMLAGERIWNIERLFNERAGLTSDEDTLPQRMLLEAMPDGPSKGHVVEIDEMIDEYYHARGWNEDGTIPMNKLEKLGIC